jgi:hypothetical protein
VKKIGIAIGVLVGIVAVAALVGWLLPREHTATRRARFTRAPAEVYAAISDFGASSSWRTGVRVEVQGDDVIVEHTDEGPMRMRVVERVPPVRMVVAIDDPELPFSGTWTYAIAAVESGTELVITERGAIDNPLVRVMAAAFFDPAETAERYLVDLGAHFGEPVTPTP